MQNFVPANHALTVLEQDGLNAAIEVGVEPGVVF